MVVVVVGRAMVAVLVGGGWQRIEIKILLACNESKIWNRLTDLKSTFIVRPSIISTFCCIMLHPPQHLLLTMTKTRSSSAARTRTAPTVITEAPLSREVEENNQSTICGNDNIDIIELLSKEDVSTKGRNVSGRSWKVKPQKRASSLIKTKINNATKSWEERQQEKVARKEALELQNELREERRQGKVLKKERRLENERRRAENEFQQAQKNVKALNTGKLRSTLKAMSKKQLRQIKKTRMNTKTGVVEYVSAYAK